MAPEQLHAFLDPARWDAVAAPADLYSLGLLLRELLTGQAPETPDPPPPLPRVIQTLLDRRAEYGPDLRRLNPRVPHALEAIAGRCLAYSQAERYQTAGDLADDLRRFLDRRPLKHARSRSAGERVGNWAVRNRRGVVAAGLATVFAFIVFAAIVPAFRGRTREAVDRPEFTRAVVELGQDRHDAALAELARLEPEARASTLPAFYSALSYARAGRLDQADLWLQSAFSRPDADAVLTAWGRDNPLLVVQAERAARRILFNLPLLDAVRKPGVRDRLERTFRLVLRLDPASLEALEGLAILDDGRGKFDAAHAALTRLIGLYSGTPRTPESRHRLASALLTRARVSARWAGSLLNEPGTGLPPAGVRDHLEKAQADLDRGATLVDPEDAVMAFDMDYIRCDTLLTQADLATREGRHDAASEFNREAERRLINLVARPPEREKSYLFLMKKVKQRLQTSVPLQEDRAPVKVTQHGG
jgi:tetratricopeptide (TPR) repeat protein